MALTPEEQRRLDELERREKLGSVPSVPAVSPEPQKARFSAFRMFSDGVGSAVIEVEQLADEAWRGAREGVRGAFGDRAASFLKTTAEKRAEEVVQDPDAGKRYALDERTGELRRRLKADDLKAQGRTVGAVESVGKSIVQFGAAFVGPAKFFKVGKAATVGGNVVRSIAAGSVVNFTAMDEVENNLANTVRDVFGVDNAVLDWLATEEEDSLIEGRLKSVAANLPVDLLAEGLVEGGIVAAKAYRHARSMKTEAKDLLDNVGTGLKADRAFILEQAEQIESAQRALKEQAELEAKLAKPPTVEQQATAAGQKAVAEFEEARKLTKAQEKKLQRQSRKEAEVQAAADNLAAEQAERAAITAPDGVTVEAAKVDAFLADAAARQADAADPFVAVQRSLVTRQRPLGSLKDLVGFLQDYVGSTDLSAEQAGKLLRQLEEDPENILPKLGVNPDRLSGPSFTQESIKDLEAFQQGVAILRDQLAAKTGRTETKSWLRQKAEATALGWAPDVLREITQATKNLSVKLTASRMILGQQSHRMLGAGEAFLKATAANRKEAFDAFLSEYHTFAAASATLRGASSEIGRALNAHQITLEVKDIRKGINDKLAAARARVHAERIARTKEERAALDSEVGEARANIRDEAKQAVRDRAKVDLTHPEVDELLVGMSDGHVDEDLIKAITERHGITEPEMLKQLGIDRADLARLRKAEEAYSDLFADVSTEAGRIRLVQKLLDTKGDLQALAREAKLRQESGLITRIDGAIRDTTGNLFTLATAGLNVIGSVAMMGGKSLGHLLSGVARGALGDHETAYRHVLTSWSLTHGFFSSFGDAITQAGNSLRRDIFEELSLNADTLGFNSAAAQLQAASATSDQAIRADGVYRRDLSSHPSFHISPSELAAIDAASKQFPPAVMLSRALAFIVNGAGSASRLGAAAFIKAPDQFAAVLATRAGAHAAAVRIAADEAVEAGLTGKSWRDYTKARAFQVADGIVGAGDGVNDPFTAGAIAAAKVDGQEYAEQVLFQDDLEWAASRALSNAFGSIPILGTLIMPFRHTPFRIIERTVLDFMPLTGLAAQRVRDAAMGRMGKEAQDEVWARWALSATLMTVAAQLVDSFDIRGYDEGSRSAGRLEAPGYSIRIGDDIIDFGRVDPFGSVIGFIVDVKQYRQAGLLEDGEARSLMDAVAFAIMRNIMSKSWLQSLSGVVDLMGAGPSASFDERMTRFAASFGSRAVPGAGLQRLVQEHTDPYMREAFGFLEGIKRASLGSGSLPVARDHILGEPIKRQEMAGLGIRGQVGSNDKLREELADLSVHIQAPPKTIAGVKMDSRQWSRFLELRGQVVRNSTGMTLRESLDTLVGSPEWKTLGRNSRVELMREAMEGYTSLARDELLREDPKLASKAVQAEILEQYITTDRSADDARAEAAKVLKALNLPPPEE